MLTPTEAATLNIASRTYRHESHRESAVWNELGLNMTRYHARVNELLSREDALAYMPVLVRRLQRVRDGRVRKSSPGGVRRA